jgi:hypothetical protein
MPDSSNRNNTEHPDSRGDLWGGAVHPELLAKRGKGGKPRRFTQDEMIAALKIGRGMKSVAARHLGCPWHVVNTYCKKFEAVRAECEAQRQAFVDAAELQLIAAVSRGDMGAVMYVLRTLGRGRGYSERTEITGKDGGPIEHAHIHLWEERLQQVHAEMAEKKAALLLERGQDGSYGEPRETA